MTDLEKWSQDIDAYEPRCRCKGGVPAYTARQEVESRPTVTAGDGKLYRVYFVASCDGCGEVLERDLVNERFDAPPHRRDVTWEVK